MFDIPLTHTTIDEEEIEAVTRVLRSKWLTMGGEVAAFEREFATLLGTPHAIAVANGTQALEIACEVAGIAPGDEVLLPSVTFVACFNALVRLGAIPVLVDLQSPDDLTLAPEKCHAAITPRTRAMIPMAHGGFPPDMGGLVELCREHNLVMVEDSCHAPLATWNDQSIGTFGDAATWSFFGNKNLTTGEGGMITTHNETIAEKCRLMRSHGITRPTWDRARGHAAGYDVALVGTNARMDEMRAAMGRVQLGKIEAATHARGEAAQRLAEYIDKQQIEGLHLLRPIHPGRSAWHLFCVLLPEGCDRPLAMEKMREKGIQTSIHYTPLHQFSATRAWFEANGGLPDLPLTDRVAPRILTLPLGPHSTTEEATRISEALASAVTTT